MPHVLSDEETALLKEMARAYKSGRRGAGSPRLGAEVPEGNPDVFVAKLGASGLSILDYTTGTHSASIGYTDDVQVYQILERPGTAGGFYLQPIEEYTHRVFSLGPASYRAYEWVLVHRLRHGQWMADRQFPLVLSGGGGTEACGQTVEVMINGVCNDSGGIDKTMADLCAVINDETGLIDLFLL